MTPQEDDFDPDDFKENIDDEKIWDANGGQLSEDEEDE